MPVPNRHGGTDTFCTCLNCHDLKDRMRLDMWPPAAFWEAFNAVIGCPPARLLLARTTALLLDSDADRQSAESELRRLRSAIETFLVAPDSVDGRERLSAALATRGIQV